VPVLGAQGEKERQRSAMLFYAFASLILSVTFGSDNNESGHRSILCTSILRFSKFSVTQSAGKKMQQRSYLFMPSYLCRHINQHKDLHRRTGGIPVVTSDMLFHNCISPAPGEGCHP
jgi:hypothetical protein